VTVVAAALRGGGSAELALLVSHNDAALDGENAGVPTGMTEAVP
jgi:hypothetical protein